MVTNRKPTKSNTMKRTDPHRKGAIIPGEYEHVLHYNLATTQDGWPIPSFRVNCELDGRHKDADGKWVNGEHSPDGNCCVVKLNATAKWAEHGNTGKCTACGSRFVYGEVWKHIPTGEHIHLGHICGTNYGMMVDRSAFELEAGRRAQAIATQLRREQNELDRAEFLANYPGLAEALETDHRIVRDIAFKFQRNCELSPKQIALVMKLHNETMNPEPEEKHAPASEGKQTFRGTVVSQKLHDNGYGSQVKITVKVDTPNGSWLAWGTAPSGILNSDDSVYDYRGYEVEITATLTRSDRDEHFAFMKRPRGKVLKAAESNE
jgi:hypothetical protein